MKAEIFTFSEKELIRDLKLEAKAVGIPQGAAEDFVAKTIAAVSAKIAKRKVMTKIDMERIVAIELKKYNADLAYVYQNRDKII